MRGLFGKKKKKFVNSEMTLQITSMADIFTLILVFLLKSSATGITSVAPSAGVTLPIAKGEEITNDVVKMELTADSIMVDMDHIVELKDFQFSPDDPAAAQASQALYKKLAEQRKIRPDPNYASDLLVLADDRTPYSTLKTALASAATAGFVDLQLVVVKAED